MDWPAAHKYCEELSLGGVSDWHLPTIGELRSLIRGCPATEILGACNIHEDNRLAVSFCDRSCKGCSVLEGGPTDGCYYPMEVHTVCKWGYWSSSAVQDLDRYAWYVDFHLGYVNDAQGFEKKYVRCVK